MRLLGGVRRIGLCARKSCPVLRKRVPVIARPGHGRAGPDEPGLHPVQHDPQRLCGGAPKRRGPLGAPRVARAAARTRAGSRQPRAAH
eukprot:3268264-Rhodomonas_salina.1